VYNPKPPFQGNAEDESSVADIVQERKVGGKLLRRLMFRELVEGLLLQ
jgi:hypothetical protein